MVLGTFDSISSHLQIYVCMYYGLVPNSTSVIICSYLYIKRRYYYYQCKVFSSLVVVKFSLRRGVFVCSQNAVFRTQWGKLQVCNLLRLLARCTIQMHNTLF